MQIFEQKKSPTLLSEGNFETSRFRDVEMSKGYRMVSDVRNKRYFTSSKSTSSAVGLPLEPLSVGPFVGPCCGPPAC